MKKLLLYGLSLAMLLSLAACGKPQADQQDTSQPNPAAISTPEPVKDTPDTEPPVTPAPEPVKDTAPEPKPEQPPVAPVKKDTPKPTEETPTPDPVEPEESKEQPSEAEKPAEEAPQTDQPKLSAKEQIENSEWFKEYKQRHPEAWVDEGGGLHSSVANGDSGDIMG